MNIRFIPVTEHNLMLVSKLHVASSQTGMVETVEQSFHEAQKLSLWRPIALALEADIEKIGIGKANTEKMSTGELGTEKVDTEKIGSKEITSKKIDPTNPETKLIGFAMYGFWGKESNNNPLFKGRVWLDRFFIDENFQGKGYAKKVLPLLLAHIKKEYMCPEIYLSVYDNNSIAIHTYKNLGFEFNGELDINREKVMLLVF